MFVYSLIIFAALSAGGTLLALSALRIPKRVKRNVFASLRDKVSLKQRFMLGVVAPLSAPLGRILPMPPRFEALLALDLARAGIPYKPKEYYARGITAGLLSAVVPFIGALMGNTLIRIGGAMLPFLVFRLMTTVHKDILKKRRKVISRDTPHFIRSILYRFTHSEGSAMAGVDIISVFEDYIRVAPASLADDIKLLVTDMKSRSVEAGLHSFADRLGIVEIRNMVSVLVGVYHGQNQASALLTLSQEADTAAREHQRSALNKMPGRIRVATIPVVAVAILALIYVLVVNLLTSTQGIL